MRNKFTRSGEIARTSSGGHCSLRDQPVCSKRSRNPFIFLFRRFSCLLRCVSSGHVNGERVRWRVIVIGGESKKCNSQAQSKAQSTSTSIHETGTSDLMLRLLCSSYAFVCVYVCAFIFCCNDATFSEWPQCCVWMCLTSIFPIAISFNYATLAILCSRPLFPVYTIYRSVSFVIARARMRHTKSLAQRLSDISLPSVVCFMRESVTSRFAHSTLCSRNSATFRASWDASIAARCTCEHKSKKKKPKPKSSFVDTFAREFNGATDV